MSGYTPDRGDIVWLEFTPQAGHEQAGHRPALTLSDGRYNLKTGLAVFCPITSKVKGYPFEVACAGKQIAGVILADQIKSLDWRARKATYIEKASTDVVSEVQSKLRAVLF